MRHVSIRAKYASEATMYLPQVFIWGKFASEASMHMRQIASEESKRIWVKFGSEAIVYLLKVISGTNMYMEQVSSEVIYGASLYPKRVCVWG